MGRVGREVASALVINRDLDSVRGPRCLWRLVQDRNSQVSAALGPQDEAFSEEALGEQHPSRGWPLPGSHLGVVCTARPQKSGPAAGAVL